ncbi:MAG: metal-dependent hydrolase [Acidithiobacillus ferrooxidans]
MGRTGHHLTGLAAGLLVAAAGWRTFGGSALAAIPFGWSGGSAPDWLEIAHAEYSQPLRKWVRQSVIPHRTITHWWLLWQALALLVAVWPLRIPAIHLSPALSMPVGPVVRMALAGFAAGGVMHLLMDVPNPTGIPILTPLARSRFGFGWWRSGNALEPLAGMAMAAVACAVLWLVVNPQVW